MTGRSLTDLVVTTRQLRNSPKSFMIRYTTYPSPDRCQRRKTMSDSEELISTPFLCLSGVDDGV